MFKEDMYSDTILAFDKKYGDRDIKSIPDSDLLLDFEIVCNAMMTNLSNENARSIIKSLSEMLREEILNRMGRYRRQAEVFSDLIYNKLMEVE